MDRKEGKTDAARTFELIREVGDKLIPGLKLTVDLPEFHNSGRCPMLDIQVWMEKHEGRSRVRHSFYQKPSTSPLVFHAGGAHTWRSKIITLAEEMRRRFLNTDWYHPEPEVDIIIKDFLQKLTDSGYDPNTRMEIMKSAARKYFRQAMDQETGGRRLHRSAGEMSQGRALKSLQASTWFKSRRGGKEATAAKDIPQTQREMETIARKQTKEGVT